MAALLASAMLVGCGPKEPEQEQNGDVEEPKYKAVLLLAGNLGDMSFLDSANRGMQMIKEQLGWEVKVIEMAPTLRLGAHPYRCVNPGLGPDHHRNFQHADPDRRGGPVPGQRYVLFDVSVDYTKGDYSNVYSDHRQNEALISPAPLPRWLPLRTCPCQRTETHRFLGAWMRL